MSAFKKLVYIQFYPDAWLNSPELRRLKPEVKGFYMDLICQLFYCFPYGHCALINYKKAKRLQNQVNQRVNHVVVEEDNDEDNLWVDLTLNFTVAKQLAVVDKLEPELHKYLPYSPDEIAMYIKILEENRVISRTASGVIFVRRMVKDFKRKVVAYLNGSKGGNPKFKKQKRQSTKQNNGLKDKNLQNRDNQVVEPSRSYSLPIDPHKVGKGESRGGNSETIGGNNGQTEPHPIFKLQKLFDKTWDELIAVPDGDQPHGMIEGLRKEGFEKWKKFVDWVVGNGFQELWRAKPLGPKDFQVLYFDKNFTEDWWPPTIEKILSTGLEPKHTLYFRIPEFMKHVSRNTKGKENSMNAGETNFRGQDKW